MSLVDQILSDYSHESATLCSNLKKILTYGVLGNTGKLLILPVDQGFEHGPDASFIKNSEGYDPLYHYELAVECGLSAYAAPLGMLEVAVSNNINNRAKNGKIDVDGNDIPLILKLNSANLLSSMELSPMQAITAQVEDAVRLGATAVGFTIYPASNDFNLMLSQLREVIAQARAVNLPTIVWSYPRGEGLRQRENSSGDDKMSEKEAQTAIDVICYAAHIAALMGAHIIKVKLPSKKIYSTKVVNLVKDYSYFISSDDQNSLSDGNQQAIADLAGRVAMVKRAAFNGRRILLFSGGDSKESLAILQDVASIKRGLKDSGGGSIIGRNAFQRPKDEAKDLLGRIIAIYRS